MAEFAKPEAYEIWMGRWSARLAPAFVGFAGLPMAGTFLDVGCGTGTLATALVKQRVDAGVVGVEPAAAYVDYCRRQHGDARLEFRYGDALALPFEDDRFDGALAHLILQELPDAAKAVREMSRVTRPGGCVAASQWDFRDGMPMLSMFWDAVIEAIDTDAARAAADRCMPSGYSDKARLGRLWEDAGLVDVGARGFEIAMEFEGFDDYWSAFLTGVSPTSSYPASLAEDQRQALMLCLRRKLSPEPDGAVKLPAKAWAVRGTVPSA